MFLWIVRESKFEVLKVPSLRLKHRIGENSSDQSLLNVKT